MARTFAPRDARWYAAALPMAPSPKTITSNGIRDRNLLVQRSAEDVPCSFANSISVEEKQRRTFGRLRQLKDPSTMADPEDATDTDGPEFSRRELSRVARILLRSSCDLRKNGTRETL